MPDSPLAIISLSRAGARLGARLRQELPESRLFVPARHAAEAGAAAESFEEPVGVLVAQLWAEHDLALIMATGIAVRLIAPLLSDKRSDPAVVVLDDLGRHTIALAGGHQGGANRLAQRIAAAVGAAPVVSTASDLHGLPRLDLLGEPFGWRLEQAPARVLAAAVDGEPLGVYQDAGETAWRPAGAPLRDFDSLEALAASGLPGVVITDRLLPPGLPCQQWVIWRPRSLVVGVGCARGASAEEIRAVVHEALARGGLSPLSLRMLASLDRKRDEPGLLAFARDSGLELRLFPATALDRVAGVLHPSEAVRAAVGTAGVAEPAALLAAGATELLVPKVKQARATAAIARYAGRALGRLSVIGLGPDGREHLTVRARQRLLEADVVLGYRPYVEQVRAWLPATPVEPSDIGCERERAARALDLALGGRKVALVSSGDPGIYGMAGLVLEELAGRGLAERRSELVEIVPGVTAASAAAAVLGAPLLADFAVLSLSDAQMPWSIIEPRLRQLASSDLTLALYNPTSRRRGERFQRACQVLLEHRPPTTPVALVRNALRPGQQVHHLDLASLPTARVDMWTLVLVAGRGVQRLGPWLVARRDGAPCAETEPPASSAIGADMHPPG